MNAKPFAISLSVIVMLLSSQASAQTFDVKEADVKGGELEFGTSNTWQRGLPPGFNRSAHDKSLDYGVSDRWRLSGILKIERPDTDGMRFAALGVENLFVFRPMDDKAKYDYGFGMFVGVQKAIHEDAQNNVQAGPVLSYKADKWSFNGNPFLEKTFGQNRVEGIALTYGWNAKYEVQKNFSVGIEGFGYVENLGSGTPFSEQQHRIGPVLYTELELAKDLTISPDLGVLFGVTSGTPDVTVKLNVGVPLYKQMKKLD